MRFKNPEVICEKCGAIDQRRGGIQRFCRVCNPLLAKQRKLAWQREHPREPRDKRMARTRVMASKIKDFGAALSQSEAKGTKLLPQPDTKGCAIQFQLSYSSLFSKNAIWNLIAQHGKPSMRVRSEVKGLRESIGWLVKEALGGTVWPQGKTWVDVVIQKPNHKSDAVNVLDTLCDGIKLGLGLDDRWFAVGVLDWEVVKDRGQVLVQLRSEHTEPRELCSNCGQIRPLDQFSKSTDNDLGVHQVCKVCTRARTNGLI